MNRRVFFRGLGWDGDGGSGRERTSPPRLIYRGTDELTGDRGTGDLDTQGILDFCRWTVTFVLRGLSVAIIS